MKLSNANELRKAWVENLLSHAQECGEDVGMIASNSFNFPVVINDEEGWVEVVVKIPKEYGDEGFEKRISYEVALKEKAEKAKAKAEAKAKKIERDKKYRAEKAEAEAEN